MKNRTTRTYTIDDELYNRFEIIIKERMINKSRLIESMIEKFVINIENDNKNDKDKEDYVI